NTIITSLKALDEGYSSKNYVKKFLRALHTKWRAKFTAIEESKDLTSLSLDELIGNIKVHEMIIKKDSEIVKAKVKRKSLALKAKNNLVMKSVRLLEVKTKITPWRSRDDKNSKSDRKYFRCGDPNHLIGECPKPPKDKNQRAFFGGSWSDSGEEDDEKVKNETCLVAQASSEICLGVDLEPDEWIKDSGCSKHMTGNQKLFSNYKAYNGGNVIFDSNLRGNIIGKGTGIETVVYAESDNAGDYVYGKSTSGICTFAGCCLTSYFSKKQTALAISTTEAEYVSVEKGACVFTEKWSLDELANGVPTYGPYQTNPSSPDDIISSIRIDQEGQVCRIRHEEKVDVYEYQIFTCEIVPTLKPLEEIILKNVFVWESERLERIVAREEVVTPLLLLLPLTNHPPLILTMMMMMMEMAKGPHMELVDIVKSQVGYSGSRIGRRGCTVTKASELNKLELPWELRGVHSTFHVLNLKKCLSDENLVISPNEIRLVNKLHFIEDPIEN
nr:retrovirus-related Pol polyprotein from transposon TNT 1-94 [Tanacetum cinerariifolium]